MRTSTVIATEAMVRFPICALVRCNSSRMTGIRGATPNQPKKHRKNANQDIWNARMGALEKSVKRIRTALLRRFIRVGFSLSRISAPTGRAVEDPQTLRVLRTGGLRGLFLLPVAAEMDENHAILNTSRKCSHTARLRGQDGHAGFQIESLAMQRADDGGAGNNSIAQRTAFVRTLVLDREAAVLETKDGQFHVSQSHGPAFAEWDALDVRDRHPVVCFSHA